MNTKMTAHAAHNCTQKDCLLIINNLHLNSLCAKEKNCVQNALFVCKTCVCVQSVCKFVQGVCRPCGLCAIHNCLYIISV